MGSRFRPLFWFLGISEDLFANDPFRSFIKVRVEGILDLQKLRPERVVDERSRGSQDDCGMTLAWVPIGLEPVAAAQCSKQAPAPAIRQRELHFDGAFGLLGSLERSENSIGGCRRGVSLTLSRGTLEESGDLTQFLAKFVFSSHSQRIVISDEKRLAVLSTSIRQDSRWLLERP